MTAVTNSINNNKPTTGNTTVANKSTSKPNSIIDEGSKNRIELTNNDLQKHIKNLKINLSESDTNRLISFVSGKTIDELNNLTSDEITCIINKIDKAMAMLEEDIATHKRKDKKIDISLIINYIRLTNGEIPKGWDSIDSFRNKQKFRFKI